jgi:hypothetical protein
MQSEASSEDIKLSLKPIFNGVHLLAITGTLGGALKGLLHGPEPFDLVFQLPKIAASRTIEMLGEAGQKARHVAAMYNRKEASVGSFSLLVLNNEVIPHFGVFQT